MLSAIAAARDEIPGEPVAGDDSVALELFAKAMMIRGVEQRLLDLFSEGKLFGTVHTCIGQEWSGIAVAEALRDGDMIFTGHRGHGHFLAFTGDIEGLIAEVMGRQAGVCGGRGGSQHLCSRGVFSNGIQGGIVPVAAGLALAQQLRATDRIAVVFIGDGTLGEGAVQYVQYRIEVGSAVVDCAGEQSLRSEHVAERNARRRYRRPRCRIWHQDGARRYVGPGQVDVDGRAVRQRSARAGKHSFLADRHLSPHGSIEGGRRPRPGRGQDLLEEGPTGTVCRGQAGNGEANQGESSIADRRRSRKSRGIAHATPSAATKDVTNLPVSWQRTRIAVPDRAVNLIHAALRRNMERDGRIILIGEDIEGPYGGAFKVTKNLSCDFPGRVRNTPISEAAIVGLGNGLALSGLVPVCEIMFGDFMGLACDQLINHASKFRYMYNDQVDVRLIVRTPMGGKRGYGPTHSQSLEKHFLGLPDTRMLALHSHYDPGLTYDALFASIDRPTIVIENKLLYGLRVSDTALDGFVLEHGDELFPTTRLRPECAPDATILCYGGMLPDVVKALDPLFDDHEIAAEVICPTQLYPLNTWPIVESVLKTGRLLVVEEGLAFAALGAEAIAQVVERAPGGIKAVRRLASPEHPIPACGPLEKLLLPGTDRVVEAVRELCAHE